MYYYYYNLELTITSMNINFFMNKAIDQAKKANLINEVPVGAILIDSISNEIISSSHNLINSKKNSFSVAIIPYTFEHTNFQQIKIGSILNIEFDILGKYISKQFK